MIRIFKNLEEYNTFTNNGQDLVSGDLYWVEDNKSAFFLTNNIDGNVKKYDMLDEIPEGYIVPSGNIAITENGEGIDVKNYASASVNVPIPDGYILPSGNKEITANGTNIDVNNYATASVNVPIPDGYIQPSGNIAITENGENIDVTNYATATVNVPSTGGGNEDLINLIERDVTTLNIPDGTTKIGNSTFYKCIRLTNVTIPNSVITIDEYAFQDCSALTGVTIGNGVTRIGNSSFNNCRRLTSITIKATTPPTLGSMAFFDTNNCHICVPVDSISAYKAATDWSEYASRIKGIGEVVGGDIDYPETGGGEIGGGDTDVPIE